MTIAKDVYVRFIFLILGCFFASLFNRTPKKVPLREIYGVNAKMAIIGAKVQNKVEKNSNLFKKGHLL